MIIDARTLNDGDNLKTDVCVIGGGAAAITLAHELENTKLDLCVLESGGLSFEDESQALAVGESTGIRYFDLDETRFRLLGGSTYRWGARGAPMKELDFQQRSWVPHSGWPISLQDLDPYYKRAHPLMGWHQPFCYDAHVWDLFDAAPPAYDPARLEFSAFQFGKILLFGHYYRNAMKSADNIRVFLHAHVLNLQSNSEGNHLNHVDIRTLDGKALRVESKFFVLASGGIENPRMLLLSNSIHSQGLCNDDDLVGRFFLEHPTVSIGNIVASDLQRVHDLFSPGLIKGRLVEVGLALSTQSQVSRECCGAVVHTKPVMSGDSTQALRVLLAKFSRRQMPDRFWSLVGQVIRNPGGLLANVLRHCRGKPKQFRMDSLNLELRIEQEPNPDSRVTLSRTTDAFGLRRAHLHWAMTERDKRTMQVMGEMVGNELGRLGIGDLRLKPWVVSTDLVWPEDMVGGHHHMGTTRMSHSPQTGIVDANCRAHAIDNLYIAGSSVFPTASFVNPTPTILALTLRLADHLKTARQRSTTAPVKLASATKS